MILPQIRIPIGANIRLVFDTVFCAGLYREVRESNSMARWLPVLTPGGGADTTTWLASAGGFLLAVTCVLAVAAVVTASCAIHLHFPCRADKSSTRSASPTDAFKIAPMSPGRSIINSCKKLAISKKRERSDQEEQTYDRGAKEEEGEGESLWQRSILMGKRCQTPCFSGHIVYDDKGNRLSQFSQHSSKLNIFHPSLQVKKYDPPTIWLCSFYFVHCLIRLLHFVYCLTRVNEGMDSSMVLVNLFQSNAVQQP